MLYIFDKDDNFKNIITEDTGLIDTRFKDYQNHLIDEPFVFHVDSESELLPLIVAENQVAFKHTFNALQQDVEMLKLMRIKEIDEIYNSDGYIVRVQCEPSWLELYDHFIEDRRIENGTAQTSMNRALQGSRWVGQVAGEFGNGSTNFYWIDAVDALFKTAEEWGGTLQDYITLDENNEIATRIMYLLPRLGRDNGLLIQPGYNAETIERRTLSYPVTAIWGQGASLEIEDEEGNHTGGYTRYITFEDVEWKKSKGDPVDKPKGQKWVGDPDALVKYGYLKADGSRMHRFGHFSNQDYETPEELLWATWEALQKEKEPEVYHEAVIDEVDKPIFLGDTGTILDRHYGKPIEVQSQITGLEYDILRPTENVNIVLGNYKDMSRDPLEDEIDEIKKEQSRPSIINDNSFPDVKPGTPVNVEAVGMFRAILVSWEYDSKIYISHYEVYASQTADFVPDAQFLVYRGRVSSFGHEVGSNETWYYRVRAVNTHGTTSEFSVQVSASSTRIDFIDLEDEIKQEIQDTKDRAEEAYDNANLATQNAMDAIDKAQQGFDKAQDAITQAGTANTKADQSLSQAQSAFNKAQESLDGLSTLVGITDEQGRELTSIKGSVQGLQASVTDLDDNVASLQMTSQSLAGRLTDAEGNLTSVSATVQGLQTQVSDVEGNLSIVTQLANTHQISISNIQGNVNRLTQTVDSTVSKIERFDNRNYLVNSDFSDDFDSWTRTIGSHVSYTIQRVATDFRQAITPNEQELRIEKTTGNVFLSQDISNIPEGTKNITIMFYVYQSISASGFIRSYLKINDDTFVGTTTEVPRTKGRLFKHTQTFDVSNHSIDELRLQINLSDYVGTVWIQAIKLTTGELAGEWIPSLEDTFNRFSEFTQTIGDITQRVQDAEGNVGALQTTATSLAGRLTDAEGNLTTLTSTVQGIQTSVSNVQGDLSQVTQLANAHQAKISNMEGDITTLTQTATSLTARIDNIGNRNYLKNSDFSDDMSGWIRTIQSYINYNVRDVSTDFRQAMTPNAQELRIEKSAGEAYLFQDLQSIPKGTEKITVSFYVYQSVQSSGYIRAYLKINDDVFVGSSTQVQQTKGSLIKFTHTYDVSNHDIDEVRLQINLSDYVGTLWIQAVSLVTGDVPLDWSPSPDDAYSQYSQLQNAINLRVKEDELLTQINLDKSGVLISGKKLILDGDTTVTGNFRVRDANIASIEAGKIVGGEADFAKFTAINMRGLDIYGSRFRSSAGTDSMEITGGNIRLSLNNGRRLDISPTGLYGYNQGGSIRFQADASLVTSAALGTSNDNVYLASNNEARVVNYSSIPGDGNVHSYSYLPIRSLVYRFPDIPNGYFTLLNGGEFRFTGENISNPVYQNLRANGYYGNFVETRPNVDILYLRASHRIRTTALGSTSSYVDLQTGKIQAHSVRNNTETSGTHFYIGTGATSTSELRVTTNGLWGGSHDDTIYTEVRASGYYGNTLDQHSGVGGSHIYVRPSSGGELRVTRTGTTTTYQAVRASAFNESSSRDYKTDVSNYEGNALDVINQLSVVNFRFKDDVENDIDDLKIGFIAEDSEPIASLDGKAIQTYKLGAYTTKAIQELSVITTDLKSEINLTREELVQKIAKLEQRINELECAA